MASRILVALLMVSLGGCQTNDPSSPTPKNQPTTQSATPPPETAPTSPQPTPATPAAGTYKVEPLSPEAAGGVQEAGESFEAPEGSDKPNPLRWTTSSGDVLTVGVLFQIDDETLDGKGKFIALVDGKRQPLASFDFNPAYVSFGYATVLSGEEVLFKGGDTGGSGDPGHMDAYLYRWNPSTKKLEEQKKWQGDGTQDEPDWAKDPKSED